MRTGRTSAGDSRLFVRLARRPEFILAVLSLFLLAPANPATVAESKKIQQPYALIAGSVFRDSGFSLPGAEIEVAPAPQPDLRRKPKRMRAVSDARGEFAIRVPAAPMRYTVRVKARGFRAQEQSAAITADERVDLFFRLEPEKP